MMCSRITTNLLPANIAPSDWMEALLQEDENEANEGATWPILLLQSTSRKLIWYLCAVLEVGSKGVPGSACRLMERYLSRHIQTYLQISRDMDEWDQHRGSLTSQYYLLAMSCIQLAAKMTDLSVPLTATLIRSTLLREGAVHSKADITQMEFHVYHTIDFRIPLWTSLDAAEFLAIHVGIGSPHMIRAIALIINMSEFHKDRIEVHMRWDESCHASGSSSSSSSRHSLRTLHVCAGVICASARFLREPVDAAHSLAELTRTTVSHIEAIADTIVKYILPKKVAA